jgi:ribose transport system substrate-binding protein
MAGARRPIGRKSSRVSCAVAVLSVAPLLLTGCNRGSSADAGGGGGSAAKASGKGLVIGWSQRRVSGSDWYKTLVAGGQSEAAKMGARIEVLDANGDTTRQNQDVQTLISKGVDVVVMNANDPLGVAPSVNALKKAGIPLVTVNSNLDPSLVKNMYCYVAEDQVATGALAGAEIAQKAVNKYGTSGEIKLLGVGGYPGDVISELRYKGFMQGYDKAMSAHPGVKTVELPFRYGHWLPDQALQPVRDVATAHPDLKIVYSESDVMQAGIQKALQQAGVWGPKLLEGSYDGGMGSIKQMMDDPGGPLQADASNQPWDQGVTAVKMALSAYNKQSGACPGGTKYIKTTVVTPDVASKYYKPQDTYVRAAEGQQ